jgi:hypothetical protein
MIDVSLPTVERFRTCHMEMTYARISFKTTLAPGAYPGSLPRRIIGGMFNHCKQLNLSN